MTAKHETAIKAPGEFIEPNHPEVRPMTRQDYLTAAALTGLLAAERESPPNPAKWDHIVATAKGIAERAL